MVLRFDFNVVTIAAHETRSRPMHAFLLAAFLAAAPAEPAAELDYSPGALAYQALVKGDLSFAEKQLEASRPANQQDMAWLLNYGQLLARQGRVAEAHSVFRRVERAPNSEVVLASGEVIGTREASRLAARRLVAQSLTSR
jgi:Tfp pilus assembly protein PilF